MTSDQGTPPPEDGGHFSEDLYVFEWPAPIGVTVTMERFNEQKRPDDIACELTVVSHDDVKGGTLINSARLLLIGPNSRRDIRNHLSGRDDAKDWGGILEYACALALRHFREGEPLIDLWNVDTGAVSRYLIAPIVVMNAVTIWYGDGSAAKSMMSLFAACCVAYQADAAGLRATEQGKVLYLDWEDDPETHAERLRAVAEGLGVDGSGEPRILYQRMSTSLYEGIREIRKRVVQNGVRLVIIDSVGMASGGDPSDANGIIKCLAAARGLGVSVIAIHHLPKDSNDKSKPYGSVYASLEARATWLFEKEQDQGSDEVRLALTNYKSNRSKLHPRQAFAIRFKNSDEDPFGNTYIESVTIEKLGFTQGADIGAALAASANGRKWKILAALQAYGPMPPSDIAIKTTIEASNVRTTLNAHKDMFTKTGEKLGREEIWALTIEASTQDSGEGDEPYDNMVQPYTSYGSTELEPALPF